MSNFSSFTNYRQTVMEITGDLKKLRDYSERLALKGNTSAIDDVLKRLANDCFSVAIIGEFNRGKSTLINALLGKNVLPTDVLPCSATLNKVAYSITPFVKIEYKDGKTEEIGIDRLSDYVTKLTRESEERAKTIKEATVYYPVNYCKNGVTIIDTPGLNDDAAMTEVTMGVLPQTDAALMVVMAQSPFSESERGFLESKIITSDLGRVLFVVTGIDLLDEDDVDRVLQNITTRIQEHVITKAKNTYGEDSKEFERYKSKLGKVKVYGLSAKKALKAKIKGDDNMLEQSHFPVFEKELELFLTEERGAIMLSVPLNRIKTSSLELVKAIQLREVALEMNKEEFNKKHNQAMEEIENIRQERQKEFLRINQASERTYKELIPAIENFWPSLEKAANVAIDGYSIKSLDEIKEPKIKVTHENMEKSVKNAVSRESQNICERIQETISTALENEAERVSGFEKQFYEATDRIQSLFVQGPKSSSGIGDAVISTAANYFLGLGGAYLGFKESGWKGALLGGATSFAGTIAGGFAAGIIFGALAIPALWPAVLIGSVMGTISSKFVLNKVPFIKEQKIEKFKSSFRDNFMKKFSEMQSESDFKGSVRGQIETAFEALKTKIRTETDNILNDTQNQLTNLKVSFAKASMTDEKEKAELKEMLKGINEICARAEETGKQLTAVLLN